VSAHKALAQVCSQLSPEEASHHAAAAEGLLQKIRDTRTSKEAEAAEGFCLPPGAERLPVRRYAFLDSEKHATVRVNLDEALFKGASGLVTSQFRHLQAAFDPGSDTAVELRIAAPKSLDEISGPLICWVLRLAPLLREVVPSGTEVRLKRGYAELKLQKEMAGGWHDSPVKG